MGFNLRVCILILCCYVMTWVLILVVPMLGLEAQASDQYVFYLLFAEEALLFLCIVVVGVEFAKDMKKKLLGKN